ARTEVAHRGLPEPRAYALAAKLRLHDVEPEEAEAGIVGDGGDAADGPAVVLGDEESVRIGGEEAARIAQAGVPAFGGGPLDGEFDLGLRHHPHGQELGVLHGLRARATV